LLSYRVG